MLTNIWIFNHPLKPFPSLLRFLWITVFLSIVLATGCTTISNTRSRSVLDDNDNSVRLESRVDDSRVTLPIGFEHPITIEEEDLFRILQSIRIVDPPSFLSKLILRAKLAPETAFIEKEARFLAKPVAEALHMATPDERVVFFLKHRRSVFKGSISSGVAFIKDKRLHFILARYRMGNQPGRPDIPVGGDPFHGRNDQSFYIVPGRFQDLIEEAKAPGGGEMVFPKRWIAIEYASLLNAPPESLDPEPSSEETGQNIADPNRPPMTIEEKLETLKRLKEKGLITEEEYSEKKRELLKSF